MDTYIRVLESEIEKKVNKALVTGVTLGLLVATVIVLVLMECSVITMG